MILEKIQKRDLSMLGPLSKVWLKMENTEKSDAPPLSLSKILSLPEQTICLLVQASNSILCYRRYNILSNVCNPQEAKHTLKNKVELLRTNNKNPFGKEFRNHLKKLVKPKKVKRSFREG